MCNLTDQAIGNVIATISAILFLLNLILTSAISIKTFNDANKDKQRTLLSQKLFELQRLSFYDPYLENENYTKEWDSLKEKYQNNNLSEDDRNKFLKYEIYTEMLFNFIYESLEFYEKKENLEKFVDFKSWVNTHKYSWKSPLQTNSNKDVYGEQMFNIVNSWIDW